MHIHNHANDYRHHPLSDELLWRTPNIHRDPKAKVGCREVPHEPELTNPAAVNLPAVLPPKHR